MEELDAKRLHGIWGGIALPTEEAMLAEIPGDPECDWYLVILFLVFLVYGYLIGRQ